MAREPFNRFWAENPVQFAEPDDNTWEKGWQGGADKNPPQARWENWWHNRADIALRQLERNGAMAWLDTVPYTKWALARGSDGVVYIAVRDSVGADPSADDGTNWLSLTDFIKSVFNANDPAPVFAVRAWANFSGLATPSIRASGNIKSVSRISEGVYELTFSTPMKDDGYSVSGSCSTTIALGAGNFQDSFNPYDQTPASFKIQTWGAEDIMQDMEIINFQVVR